MIHRYIVHFQVSPEIEVSVLVSADKKDDELAISLARNHLLQNPLGLFINSAPAIVDHLETIEGGM